MAASITPAQAQDNFERGVAMALQLWPALTLSVQNHWGGPDSADKRDWFAGAVVENLFPTITKLSDPATATYPPPPNPSSGSQQQDGPAEEPDLEYVETFLLQVMEDEFEVEVDDDSSLEIAEQILRLRKECLVGGMGEFEQLQQRWSSKQGAKLSFKRGQDQGSEHEYDSDEVDDDDDEDEDEEGDVGMDDAPPLVATRREKEEPEVDEDGFTKVTRKKK